MEVPAGVFRSSEKMGETETQAAFTSGVGLKASISFSQFETNPSSWERWSCFSPNKYLEEVEKCASAGSVAQKKAYFEAHHKKIIAAQKAELPFNQEKQVENLGSIRSPRPDSGNPIHYEDGVSDRIEFFEIRNSGERATGDEDVSGDICRSPDGPKEGKEENRSGYCLEESKSEGISSGEEVKEVPTGSPEVLEEPKKDCKTGTRNSPKTPEENRKLNLQRKTPKANPKKYEDRNTPRKLPGTSTGTEPTSLKYPTRSGSMPSLNRSKNLSEKEQKRTVFPKSLHMSMSLGAAQKSPTLPPSITQTRKSVIMERVGDKDTVKRALRSFHNRVGHPKSFIKERSPLQKPAPSVTTELRASASLTNQKDSGRPLRAGAAVGTTSFGSGSNEREEKRKEFQKKHGERSTEKVEGTRSRLKSKEEKEVEIQRPRKNPNFKATPLPSFYQGLSKSKSSIRQDGYKSEIRE